MKKIIAIIMLVILLTGGGTYLFYDNVLKGRTQVASVTIEEPVVEVVATPTPVPTAIMEYQVYVEQKLSREFASFDAALAFAKMQKNASICKRMNSDWLWDNYSEFLVSVTDDESYEFNNFSEAVKFAKQKKKAYVVFRKDNAILWSSEPIKPTYKIQGVARIDQLPELPKGCEVTSLAMLINFKGIAVDKLRLEEQIKKVPATTTSKGKTYYGNPHQGFVGSMRRDGFGFGVYHGPIYDLLAQYFPRSAIDFTGCNFEDLLHLINSNVPIWTIINTGYTALPDSSFQQWITTSGPIKITYQEHSVLVTGYDEKFIYFNDPLGNVSQASRSGFIMSWEQMGRQAVALSQ